MAQPRIEVTPTRPMETYGPRPDIRVIGSTIIARFPQCMLKEPRPAAPVSRPK